MVLSDDGFLRFATIEILSYTPQRLADDNLDDGQSSYVRSLSGTNFDVVDTDTPSSPSHTAEVRPPPAYYCYLFIAEAPRTPRGSFVTSPRSQHCAFSAYTESLVPDIPITAAMLSRLGAAFANHSSGNDVHPLEAFSRSNANISLLPKRESSQFTAMGFPQLQFVNTTTWPIPIMAGSFLNPS